MQLKPPCPVFAVIRIDHYLRDVTSNLHDIITVKEVLFSREEAAQEAARLNDLAEGRTGLVR